MSLVLILILELKELYNGIRYGEYTVRLAPVRVMCDLPASRKACGFSSLHGCNKCLKEFTTQSFGDSPDYSGYNRMQWRIKDVAQLKVKCYEYLKTNTKNKTEFNSKLIELPYFNPIKYTVIDPMHNLFLGTAKHCSQLWIKKEILSQT